MQSINNIYIEATTDTIYPYLLDVDNRSAYIPQLKRVDLIDPLPFKEGSKYIEVATIAGQELKTTYQITVLVPGRIISARTVKSIFPIQVDLLLEPQDTGTNITIQLEFTLRGIFKLASGIVKGIVDEQSRGILTRLKRELE
ncbi:MAG: SRPBCC family protein [Bacteroidia bacterium]|nr:SRPBCC family protein [Bacteroidia bacterium]